MKSTRLFALVAPIALALLLVSCAQMAAPQHTLSDDVALRIAKATLLGEAITMTKQELLGNIDMDVVMQPLDESLDLKAARILVHGYSDQSALQSSARLFDANFQSHTKDIAQMADLKTPNSRYTASFADRILSDAASSKDKSNKDTSDWPATLEKSSLELLNSSADKAALVKQTAELLPALRSQETLTTVERLRAAVSQALARHPEQLKPFSEERPLSPTIRAALDRLQRVLQSPAK